jgi:hypothetical protein
VWDHAGRSPQHRKCRARRMAAPSRSEAARKMSRGEPRSPARKARATEFKRLFEAFGFTGHRLQKFAQACRDNCWIKDLLPGHVAQTAATRAFTLSCNMHHLTRNTCLPQLPRSRDVREKAAEAAVSPVCGRNACRAGFDAPFWRGTSRMVVSMRSKDRYGSAAASGIGRI